jgi:hypothetical protein
MGARFADNVDIEARAMIWTENLLPMSHVASKICLSRETHAEVLAIVTVRFLHVIISIYSTTPYLNAYVVSGANHIGHSLRDRLDLIIEVVQNAVVHFGVVREGVSHIEVPTRFLLQPRIRVCN